MKRETYVIQILRDIKDGKPEQPDDMSAIQSLRKRGLIERDGVKHKLTLNGEQRLAEAQKAK